MLDLKFIRRNPDAIRTMLEQRRMAAPLDQLLEMDSQWREAVTGVENARHHQNTISKGIAQLKMNKQNASEQISEMKQLSQEIKSLNKQSNILRQQIDEMLLTIPNLPDKSTPVGGSEEDNVEIKRWGHPRTFDFEPRPALGTCGGIGYRRFWTRHKKSPEATSYCLRVLARGWSED